MAQSKTLYGSHLKSMSSKFTALTSVAGLNWAKTWMGFPSTFSMTLPVSGS